MAPIWEEVRIAQAENRRELTLQGPETNKRIVENGLDEAVFKLTSLNMLKITGTPLVTVSERIQELSNLTSLTLANNKLTQLPSTVAALTGLKFLDVSGNCLQSLPEIKDLVNLQSLNANLNDLTAFPSIANLKQLAHLYISRNKLTALPDGISSPELSLLSTIDAANNEIKSLPDDLSNLPHLTTLNVSANKLETLPLELSECNKLKELIIADNKMKDRKFLKLADHSTKSLLAYLRTKLDQQRIAEGASKGKKSKGKKKKGDKSTSDFSDRDVMYVTQFNPDTGITVQVTSTVMRVRQYIVCCIIRNLDFSKSNNMFKRFINLQTKLHETVCDKRNAATIATHDLQLIKPPLLYDAVLPTDLLITPLFKSKETSGELLMKELRDEADEFRKEKKRNQLSGIHKYLDLLKDKSHYPCLKDTNGVAISFPPITNSEKTKITKETKDILIEVTSSVSLELCKKVMEEILLATLLTGLGTKAKEGQGGGEEEKEDEATGGGEEGEPVDTSRLKVPQSLTVEQVKVLDQQGNLRVIYPSRVDLQNPAFDVVRDYE